MFKSLKIYGGVTRIVSDFIRARTDEQKAERMDEVKKVTAKLFKENPYHEITLTTIGDELGWSRANLYKYVSSKEEIFLQLSADARDSYYNDIIKTFSKDTNLSNEEISSKWAKIANNNKNWAIYGSILVSIIETNVTLERLKQFKKEFYDQLSVLCKEVAPNIRINPDDFPNFFNTIHYHAVGLCGFCETNPLVVQAIKELGVNRKELDFESEMNKFILMCLNTYSNC